MERYFAHITENTLVSISTYRKPGFYQADDTGIFDSEDSGVIITLADCDSETEAAQRLKDSLEDGAFLASCNPEPTEEQIEELYDSIVNYIRNNRQPHHSSPWRQGQRRALWITKQHLRDFVETAVV